MEKNLILISNSILLFSILIPLTMATNQELQTVVQGNGLFTKNLYDILSKNPGNVFFSPISAHAVLAMAYQGAAGKTKEAFAKTLSLPDASAAAEGYNAVMSHLNNVPNVTLLMANKIYIMEGRTMTQSFKDATKRFLSEVENANFADNVNTAKKINGWVEEKTHDKIKDLITPDDINGDTRLVLLNAIYFKGNWASKFKPEFTKTEKFYLNDQDTVDVQMMNQKSKYLYKEDPDLDAKVLEMPYSNPDVSLVIVLPNQKNGISELEKKLVNTDLTKLTERMYKVDVNVKMPKFKIETTIDLNDALTKAGLGVIFSNAADFSNMLDSPEPLYVSKVVQKAFIEVNEEGAEAAAATGMGFALMSAVIMDVFDFHAEHPFQFYLIKCEKPANQIISRTILFSGRMSNPKN